VKYQVKNTLNTAIAEEDKTNEPYSSN